MFNSLDKDKDGIVSFGEMDQAMGLGKAKVNQFHLTMQARGLLLHLAQDGHVLHGQKQGWETDKGGISCQPEKAS